MSMMQRIRIQEVKYKEHGIGISMTPAIQSQHQVPSLVPPLHVWLDASSLKLHLRATYTKSRVICALAVDQEGRAESLS